MRIDVVREQRSGTQWLVTRALETGASGMVAVVTLAAGEETSAHGFSNAETVTYLLSGAVLSGDAALHAGEGIYSPPGSRREVRALEPSALLVIYGGVHEPSDLLETTASASTLRGTQIGRREDVASDNRLATAGGFVDMDVRWLATTFNVGTRNLVVATSVFTPGGTHGLHRHPNAAEFFLVLSGHGDHLTETGSTRLERGGFVYVPANEWHGFRTDPGVVTRAVYGYLGVGSLEEAGYELCRHGWDHYADL